MSNVEIRYLHWSGSRPVSAGDSEILVVDGYIVDDLYVNSLIAEIVMDGPFMTIEIGVPEDLDDSFRERWQQVVDELRSHYTAEDWLEGTTDEVLILPVARVSVVEGRLSEGPLQVA